MALLGLHGALPRLYPAVADLATGVAVTAGPAVLASAIAADAAVEVRSVVSRAADDGIALAELRTLVARGLRRRATVDHAVALETAGALVEGLVSAGELARTGDLVHLPERTPGIPADVLAAMARLEVSLDSVTPPPLPQAASVAGCPPEGVKALEVTGRIVRVDDDLAWSAAAFARLQAVALGLATPGPLTPAGLRDATGTSRKFVMALLEELNRRGVLARTPAGHVRGPRSAGVPAVALSDLPPS